MNCHRVLGCVCKPFKCFISSRSRSEMTGPKNIPWWCKCSPFGSNSRSCHWIELFSYILKLVGLHSYCVSVGIYWSSPGTITDHNRLLAEPFLPFSLVSARRAGKRYFSENEINSQRPNVFKKWNLVGDGSNFMTRADWRVGICLYFKF